MRQIIAFCWEMIILTPLLIVIVFEGVIILAEKLRKKLKLHIRLSDFANSVEYKILGIETKNKK